MSSTKRYWQDLAQLDQATDVVKGSADEFRSPMAIDEMLGDSKLTGARTDRRDFLKFLGFGLGAATLAACEAPVIKSIPYVVKPEEITPGVANWYASTYFDGDDFASILVKTREGRPIHIKGNSRFGINHKPGSSKGSVNARINSSVLPLYDSMRLQGPVKKGAEQWDPQTWEATDKAIGSKLAEVGQKGGRIVLLTGSIISPSTKAAIELLKAKYGTAAPATEGALTPAGGRVEHIQYDTISAVGITAANFKSFGKRVVPSYDLTKADVIVGIDADFLSTWGSSTEHTWQYATRRNPESAESTKSGMSRHWQFESLMSLAGANADVRVPVKLSELAAVVMSIHDHVAGATGNAGRACGAKGGAFDAQAKAAAAELVKATGKSVVLCGVNDENVQVLVNSINHMLGNYGSTIDLDNHTWFKQGDDAAVAQLVKDMNAGSIGALLIAGVNPVYTLPNAAEFKTGLTKVGLSVSFSGYADETASLCQWICPDNHYLESWNDYMPKVGHYAIAQPVIGRLYNTRQWQKSILAWAGDARGYHDFMQGVWRQNMDSHSPAPMSDIGFTEAWNMAVHNGAFDAGSAPATSLVWVASTTDAANGARKLTEGGEWEVQLYTKESIGNGLHANNPWLQELPDPITKSTWDNYIRMSPEDMMEKLGMTREELYVGQEHPAKVATVTVGGATIDLPVLASPGQARGTMAIALGYGRGANKENVGRAACIVNDDGVAEPVGKNAYPLTSVQGGATSYIALKASIALNGASYSLALSQTQLTDMERHSVVKETSYTVWALHTPKETYNEPHELRVHHDVNHDGKVDNKDKEGVEKFDLWEEHAVEGMGHRWGMSIDLNSCIGCGACVTACNSENNIPVVGKDEVRRSREMHWMRIDRYFSSDMTHHKAKEEGTGKIDMFAAMEVPQASPRVMFQPVMCQHCNHAPCETVCPVAATTHSLEGLNMMAYNRCIGTRYCANNCPYKVRRFNWWNYVTEQFGQVNPAWDSVGRLVLNPDVVVRGRGVIEKCSLCVQQIQGGKLAAKKAGRMVKDGEIETACSAGCPTNAITFGDLNDEKSSVTALAGSERSFHMLEDVGTKPNINYLAKVRNVDEDVHAHAAAEPAHA